MDFLLVGLIAHSTGRWWILYIVAAVTGSMVGVFTDDILSRKAGEEGLKRFASREQTKRLKPFVRTRAGWALFIGSIVPPPFPFTLVVLIATPDDKLYLACSGVNKVAVVTIAMKANNND